MTIIWPLATWEEPDLDHGHIIHRTKSDDEVKQMAMSLKRVVWRAADQYAVDADAAGIAVTVHSWLIVGKEFDV